MYMNWVCLALVAKIKATNLGRIFTTYYNNKSTTTYSFLRGLSILVDAMLF